LKSFSSHDLAYGELVGRIKLTGVKSCVQIMFTIED